MHVLHGTWLGNAFALWGEDTAREPVYRRGRRGRLAPHPFALSGDDWDDLRFLPDDSRRTDDVTLWLPGIGKKPQPSPAAESAGWERPTGDMDLLGWEVEAVPLSPLDALDLLVNLPPHPRGVLLGADMAFWREAALALMGMLIEGRFIPAITQQGAIYVASWQPRPDPDLRADLIAAMPPLCRAVCEEPEDAPEPYKLLDEFFATLLEAFIRDRIRPRGGHPWWHALTSPDSIIGTVNAENRALHQAWERWQSVAPGSAGTFRVCFRLGEPDAQDEDWPLAYMLQAVDDPSLLVQAGTVWAARGDTLDYLQHRFDRPRERMLAALGLASRVFPPVERSLHEREPVGVMLDHDEALAFLVEAAPVLEASGFAVQVPNWWGRRARIRAKAKIKGSGAEPTGILSHENLLKYEWQLSLGGQPLNREEFEQLAALKQPLVRYKGEWVALSADQIEAARRFFDQVEEGEIGLLDALKLSANGQEDAPEGIEVEGTMVEGWLAELVERLQNPDASTAPAQPDGLRAQLRPYQERGFGWLVEMRRLGLGACLADDMGLGKTIQTIALWLYERDRWDVRAPALLVCPTSVVGNWRHEIQRFAPSLRVMKHQGPDRLKDETFAAEAQKADVVLTSFALIHRDFDTLERVRWSTVVLDEAQNIKNPSTKQAQAARALPAEGRLALTGTPVENRLRELWSIMQFLNPGYLGSRRAFRKNFATPIERYNDAASAASLRKLVGPFILRRLKTDPNVIQDLPEKFENKVYCTLTEEQATLYEAVVREEMAQIEDAEDMARRGAVLRMLTRLKQICNHPAHFLKEGENAPMAGRSGKLERLTGMLEEVRENDERALIFTQYAEMGTMLQSYLKQHLVEGVLFLHGGTPSKEREEMVRHFQSAYGPPIFILSLRAGGTGLNLTHANHVFHFDRWYNPAVEDQATDRAFRIGQARDVEVHKFICLGTLEERIDELIEHKRALADQIVGTGEGWISEMGSAELRDLVSLRRETVEG